jgi:hypothetical protein
MEKKLDKIKKDFQINEDMAKALLEGLEHHASVDLAKHRKYMKCRDQLLDQYSEVWETLARL